MSDPLIGEIKMFGPGWAPKDWGLCMGTIVAIADNTALYSLIGTIYGGDGRSSMGLPDTRGRAVAGYGQGPYTENRALGHFFGFESVILSKDQLPAHNHAASVDVTKWTLALAATATAVNPSGIASAVAEVNCSSANGDSTNPVGRYPADANPNTDVYSSVKTVGSTMAADMVEVTVTIDALIIPITVTGSVALTAQAGAVTTANTGGGQAFNISQPSIGMNYIIAMDGTYPSRN